MITQIPFTNPEEIIQDMRIGLEVLDSVKIEYKLVDNWKQYLETYLLNENIIEDRQSFADLLQSKFEQNPNCVTSLSGSNPTFKR